MAKAYQEGGVWSIREQYRGKRIYLTGFASARAAERAIAEERRARDNLGAGRHQGPERTALGVAFSDYARERLPFLKGARQDSQRINQYLRALNLPVVHLAPLENGGDQGPFWEVSFVKEAARKIPKSLQPHRAKQTRADAKAQSIRRGLARMHVADICNWHVQELMDALRAAGKEAATMARECSELRRLFNYARKSWHWAKPVINPTSALKMPKVENERDVILTETQWSDIAAKLALYDNPHVYPATVFLLQTAMRSSEALVRARWCDINWETRLLHLDKCKAGARDVPLSPDALALLEAHQARMAVQDASAYIFPTTYEALKKAWNVACEQAGVTGVRLHDLRHTAATRFALAFNGNTFVLKIITGHKTDAMLRRYVNIKPEMVSQMMSEGAVETERRPASGRVRPPEEIKPVLVPGKVVSLAAYRRCA
jgi:integrase